MTQSNGAVNGHYLSDTNGEHATNSQTVPLIIGGQDVVTAKTFTVHNPRGGDCWESSAASVEDANRAVEAALAAFPSWSKTKPAKRRDIFLRAADIFDRRQSELAVIQKVETGADDLFMDWILKLTVDNLKEVAGKCSAVSGLIPDSSEEGRAALVLKEPYGVVLGISPWCAVKILYEIFDMLTLI